MGDAGCQPAQRGQALGVRDALPHRLALVLGTPGGDDAGEVLGEQVQEEGRQLLGHPLGREGGAQSHRFRLDPDGDANVAQRGGNRARLAPLFPHPRPHPGRPAGTGPAAGGRRDEGCPVGAPEQEVGGLSLGGVPEPGGREVQVPGHVVDQPLEALAPVQAAGGVQQPAGPAPQGVGQAPAVQPDGPLAAAGQGHPDAGGKLGVHVGGVHHPVVPLRAQAPEGGEGPVRGGEEDDRQAPQRVDVVKRAPAVHPVGVGDQDVDPARGLLETVQHDDRVVRFEGPADAVHVVAGAEDADPSHVNTPG